MGNPKKIHRGGGENYLIASPTRGATRKESVIKMGKAKRSKDKRAAAALNNPSAYAEKTANSGTALKIALAVIAVIVVASIVFAFVQSSGLLLRTDYGFKSENFEIDGAMMQYLYHTQIYNFDSSFGQYIYYMVMMGQSTVDFSRPLSSQKYTEADAEMFGELEGGTTWQDYFWRMAENSAKQVLFLCERAKAEGVYDKYKEEMEPTVKERIDAHKDAAKNFSSSSAYFEYLYGAGVKAKDVENMELLAQIAAKYYSDMSEKFLDELTEEQILKWHEENRSQYLYADYYAATFTATIGKKPTAEEKTKFEEDIKKAKENAEAFAKLTTAEEIRDFLANYWLDNNIKDKIDSQINSDKIKDEHVPKDVTLDKIIEAIKAEALAKAFDDEYDTTKDSTLFTETDYPEIYKTLNKAVKAIISGLKTADEKNLIEKDPFAETSDKDKWLFDEERKVGDTGIFYGNDETKEDAFKLEDVKDEEGMTYYVHAFNVVKTGYLDEKLTIDFGQILLLAEGGKHSDDKEEVRIEKLDEIMKLFQAGELTAERFEELGKDESDSEQIMFEAVKEAGIEELDEWLFDEERKPGDVKIIKSEDYGHHLLFYKGENKPVWFVDSKNDLHVDTVDKWYESVEKEYESGLKINNNFTNKLSQASGLYYNTTIGAMVSGTTGDGHDH